MYNRGASKSHQSSTIFPSFLYQSCIKEPARAFAFCGIQEAFYSKGIHPALQEAEKRKEKWKFADGLQNKRGGGPDDPHCDL